MASHSSLSVIERLPETEDGGALAGKEGFRLNDYRLKAGRLMLRLKVAGLRLKPPKRRFG